MKNILVLFFCTCVISQSAYSRDRDTSFARRPYYIGLTCAYTDFMKNTNLGTPSGNHSQEFNYGVAGGISLAFPFFKRWENETGAEYIKVYGWEYSELDNVTPYSNTGWTESKSHHTVAEAWRVRTIFSYEFFRGEKIALLGGAGGWMSRKLQAHMPGTVAVEAGLKVYYSPWKNAALQLGSYYGRTNEGNYLTVRAAVLFKGVYPRRVKPVRGNSVRSSQ